MEGRKERGRKETVCNFQSLCTHKDQTSSARSHLKVLQLAKIASPGGENKRTKHEPVGDVSDSNHSRGCP